MKPKLSVIIITKNEEENIEECLKHIAPLAEEIIIVDSYSTDKTVEIAKKFTNKIFQGRFNNYKEKREFALSKASSDWILFLDADERITPLLGKEIQEAIKSQLFDGYLIPFKDIFLGKWLKHGGWSGYLPRLAKRSKASIQNEVHERLVINGRVGKLSNRIIHYSDPSLHYRVFKTNNYTTLQAVEYEKNHNENQFQIILKIIFLPFIQLIKTYFFQCGFLDGMPGLIRAIMLSYTTFLLHAKRWELRFAKPMKKSKGLPGI